MKLALLIAILLSFCLVGCGQRDSAGPNSQTNTAAAGGHPITAPVDYVGAVGQAQKHSLKVVDTVQVQQAIGQFHAVEDRYPKQLDELVKEGYLAKLPALPAGMRFEYHAANGQVKVVSVNSP